MCVCLYIRIYKYTSNVNTLVEEGTWKDRLFIINGQQFDTWPTDVNLNKFVDEIGRIVKQVEKLYISRSRKLYQYIIVKWNGEEAATWPSTGPIKFWFQEQIESLYHMWNLGLPIQLPLPFFFPLQICLLHMTSHVQQNIGFWIHIQGHRSMLDVLCIREFLDLKISLYM